MSKAEDLRWRLEREREQALQEAQARETASRLLDRHEDLLSDLQAQGLDAYVPEEARQVRQELARARAMLQADPAAARTLGTEIGPRVHGLPALARAAVRAAREAELRAEAEREAREQAMLDELEQVWRAALTAWDDALARQLAVPALSQLRREMLQRERAATPAQLQEGIERVRLQACGRADAVRQAAVQEAEAAAARQLRHQLKQSGEEAPDAAAAHELASRMAQALEQQDRQAVDETARREVVCAVNKALLDAGFVVEKPRRVREGGSDEVVLRAARPAGAEATFRVDLGGAMHYAFDRYEGTACRRDIERVLPRLETVYGIRLSDRRVVWENPDDLHHDARPLSSAPRGTSHG